MMAIVQDILAHKGFDVHTIPSTQTVLEATQLMNDRRIGGVVVMEQGKLVGMFTERDVLRRVVAAGRDPKFTYVSEVMTHNVTAVPPNTNLDDVSVLMKTHRIRHIPVTSEDGDLMGMVSIGDLNAHHAGHQASQIEWLNEYAFGRV
jgi:CBS domain-containing protein